MVKIFHNPNCGMSRTTLGFIRDSSVEHQIVLYQ